MHRNSFELEKIGIIETPAAGIRLCESINTVLLNDDITSLQKVFCHPLNGKALSLEEFTISDEEKSHVIKVLCHTSKRPVHILLYGAPGTGKTSFAHSLASELNLKAWAVPCHEGDSSHNRRASLTTCLRMAANHKNSFVLVDEAERLLDTGESMDGSSSSKAWLTAFLEMPEQRVIWISNHVSDIDPAVRRRFTYSIHFEDLDRNARRKIWLRTMQRLHVEERIPTKTVEAIAEHYEVPVAVMENALHQAKMLAPRDGFAACVERVLTAFTTLSNDGEKDERKKKRKGTYSLDGICTVKPFAPQIEQLRRLDAYLRDNEDTCAGMGTLLFYGPPGTGKTALAKHLGYVLDRKCCIKRGSDLLSPYVGEAEKNIATAFNDASHNGDILIIDEVDSFLTKREHTHHSWEASQINEFLTALECFSGLCICTTNRRKDMYPAVMRRFSFKIAFGYAGPTQLTVLYDKLLAPLVGSPVPKEITQRLCSQKSLTPGDFHAVRMQHWLHKTEAVSHQMLLEALLQEQATKLDKSAHRIGF